MKKDTLLKRMVRNEIVIDFSDEARIIDSDCLSDLYFIEFRLYNTELCYVMDEVRLELQKKVLPMYSLCLGETDKDGRYEIHLNVSQRKDEEPVVHITFTVRSTDAVDDGVTYDIPLSRQEQRVILQIVEEQTQFEFNMKFIDFVNVMKGKKNET